MRITGDGITFALATGAAVSSAAFAGYMWIVNPAGVTEGRVILNELPASAQAESGFTGTRPIDPTTGESSDGPTPEIAADQITTASTARAQEDQPDSLVTKPDALTQSLPGRLKEFQLIGIYGDTALVGPSGSDSGKVWPVKVGTTLPGAGRVISIVTGRTRETVFTTKGVIVSPIEAR